MAEGDAGGKKNAPGCVIYCCVCTRTATICQPLFSR